ncbi:hypothetical protein BH10PLA2_BH10PLA2_08190 [soil metagenome]
MGDRMAYLRRLGLGGGQAARKNKAGLTNYLSARRFDMRSTGLRRLGIQGSLWTLTLTVGSQLGQAQVIAPPAPASYNAQVRYVVGGPRLSRLEQFFSMTKYLEAHGFKKADGSEELAEDPAATILPGTVSAVAAHGLLGEPHVRSVLLTPPGFQLPDGDQPVKIQIELDSGRELHRQRLLSDQAKVLLATQGFQDGVGYDNRGHTRLIGTIPASSLLRLLDDLRVQTGWLAPSPAVQEMPEPIRSTWPIRVVEVIPEPAGVTPSRPVVAEPAVPAGQANISPELRALAAKDDLVRMEVILVAPPVDQDKEWRAALRQAAPDSLIEGRIGPIVTVKTKARNALTLATVPGVSTIRLPVRGQSQVIAPPADSLPGVLGSNALQFLRSVPQQGLGLRIAVLDSDFRGAASVIGKRLPGSTQFIDLGSETDPALQSASIAGIELGSGVRSALAIAKFAPRAEFTLLRIDPEAPFQLLEAARFIQGEEFLPESLLVRAYELTETRDELRKKKAALLTEREAVLDTFAVDQKTLDRRDTYFKNQATFDLEEKRQDEREKRYLRLVSELRSLRGIKLVVNDLFWAEGQPAEGASTLAHFFNDAPFRAAAWFQAGGLLPGQVWSGLFRDLDGNRVMEFAGPRAPLAAGRWTSELDFLGFQPMKGSVTNDLPKGTYRITVQWREAHDPTVTDPAHYRNPLAKLRLVVLHQRDPQGKLLATDQLDVVASTYGLPQRLDQNSYSSTYEQSVEFTVDQPGRFALRVEGQAPTSLRPSTVPNIPALNETRGELRPRILIQNVDADSRLQGRPLFLDYATTDGSQGIPAGALGVTPIEAARE